MVFKSPLHSLHQQLDARFTEFFGYEMPLQFTSIKDEHLTVRKAVGLFDVSHMSNVWITGKDAEKLISLTTVEDASRIPVGKGQYTELLREDGTIIDDTIFLHLPEKFMMMPNAGMSDAVTSWLNAKAKEHSLQAKASDVSRDFAILAVQGPKSRETLQKITTQDISLIPFFGCTYMDVASVNCIISYTGYTGERGFEMQITPADKAKQVFQAILDAGKEFGIKPVGLGARDSLRLEKCFFLAGNEFAGGRTPLEATLGWTVFWDHDFIGKDALLKQKESGAFDRITCLECVERGIPRHGNEIHKEGRKIGVVTSGSLSPCLNTGIALGYVPQEYREVGSSLDIVIRDKPVKARVVKPPFVPKDWLQKQAI